MSLPLARLCWVGMTVHCPACDEQQPRYVRGRAVTLWTKDDLPREPKRRRCKACGTRYLIDSMEEIER